MVKEGVLSRIFLRFFIVVALVHTATHFMAFGTGINGFGTNGLSGYALGSFKVGDELQASFPLSLPLSRIVILVEWGMVVGSLLFVLFRQHRNIASAKVITTHTPVAIKRHHEGLFTDVDKLLVLVKENQRVRLSSIMKQFSVDKEVAMNWGRTLEGGNLIVIEYPTFGEPEFVYKEPIVHKKK